MTWASHHEPRRATQKRALRLRWPKTSTCRILVLLVSKGTHQVACKSHELLALIPGVNVTPEKAPGAVLQELLVVCKILHPRREPDSSYLVLKNCGDAALHCGERRSRVLVRGYYQQKHRYAIENDAVFCLPEVFYLWMLAARAHLSEEVHLLKPLHWRRAIVPQSGRSEWQS